MLQVGINIKEIRAKKGLLQKEEAATAGLHLANYNKMEKEEGEPPVDALDKISKLFDMTVDQIINHEGDLPQGVTIENKSVMERMKLIEQLEKEDKQAIFRIIDGVLTKSMFKDFFNKNVAAL
ncbi:helix-turn-helix transcriptional regulator [Reichenbachiella sp. MALMAid0571]|uniref:helix-turn-helix domain-containing protein n=1 Tax=Reichenbachiella sp. MALMAid0571 TaxID=3143939 RepID=UPI0032DFA078